MQARLLSAIMFVGLSIVGCQHARLPVPANIDAERLPVTGRQGSKIAETIQFGSFQVTAVDRSWVRGPDRVLFETLERRRRRQSYSYDVREYGGTTWHSDCKVSLIQKSVKTDLVDIIRIDDSDLSCTIVAEDADETHWMLTLSSKEAAPFSGTLESDSISVQVFGTNKVERGLPLEETTGYEIFLPNGETAFVDILGNGVVWLPEIEGSLRAAVGATIAGLLLYEDLRGHLPETS